MLIEIEKVIVKDRIRKDYGDIEELAQDIKENGLINPPVVTPEYELIAGERRLRAMQQLGYQQIEVRVMKVNDYIHQLNLEISENESRKEFTKKERFEYTQKLIELKRLEGANLHLGEDEITEEASKKSGIGSRRQFYKEKAIVENADKETLEQWDKGDISTHAAYQKIVKEKEELELKLKAAEKEVQEKVTHYNNISESYKRLENVNKKHYEKAEQLKKELEETKKQLSEAQASGNDEEAGRLSESLAKTDNELANAHMRIEELERQLKEKPIETTATEIIEKVPDEVQKELDELRQKASQPGNDAAIKFKVYFDELVNGFKALLGALAEIPDDESERYKKAVIGLISKMSERLT